MEAQFGEWLRLAHLEPDHDIMQRRWAGVEKAAEELDASGALELAMLFHRLPAAEETTEWLRSVLHQADNAFRMADNDAELSVLAGAVIASVIRHADGTIRPVASLALVCPALMGHRKHALVPEIVDRGRQCLAEASAALRSTASASLEPNTIPTSENLLEQIKTACQDNQPPTLAEPLYSLLTNLDKALRKVNTNAKKLNGQFALYREESDVLWWLTAAHSRDLDCPFGELQWPSTPLHVGKELADLVRQLPGPLAHRGVIARAMDASGNDPSSEISLSSAVTKMDKELKQEWMEGVADPAAFRLCPVMNAISMSNAAGKQTEWMSSFKATMGISADTKFTPVDLAVQVFYESLLIRSAAAAQA